MRIDPGWLETQGAGRFVGILLAAGRGRRFDPAGVRDKLLQPFTEGQPVVAAAASTLLAAVPAVLAVVRPAAPALEQVLRKAGCEVSVCDAAAQGMAASLVHALQTVRAARGWIVALGDMPHVQPSTTQALASALEQGAQIAVPVHQGRRGNPVAFGAALLPELLQLRGDEGARRLLHRFPLTEVAVDDAGIFRDIDTADDLAR